MYERSATPLMSLWLALRQYLGLQSMSVSICYTFNAINIPFAVDPKPLELPNLEVSRVTVASGPDSVAILSLASVTYTTMVEISVKPSVSHVASMNVVGPTIKVSPGRRPLSEPTVVLEPLGSIEVPVYVQDLIEKSVTGQRNSPE